MRKLRSAALIILESSLLCILLIPLASARDCADIRGAITHISKGQSAQRQPDTEIVAKLKQATQELLDAIAPGTKSVWERYLAAGSIYADEEGRVLTKDELLKELTPLPKGYVGSIKIADTKALVQDNVVVLSHRDREELELYNPKIVTYYHMTNTWAKQRDGQWQVVATHVMAIPNGDMTMKEKDGNAVPYAYCDIYCFSDGKIAELNSFVIKTEAKAASASGV